MQRSVKVRSGIVLLAILAIAPACLAATSDPTPKSDQHQGEGTGTDDVSAASASASSTAPSGSGSASASGSASPSASPSASGTPKLPGGTIIGKDETPRDPAKYYCTCYQKEGDTNLTMNGGARTAKAQKTCLTTCPKGKVVDPSECKNIKGQGGVGLSRTECTE